MSPNKKKGGICINLKINVICVACMVIGHVLVVCLKENAVETNFIHKDDYAYLDVFDFFKNSDKIESMLSGGILRDN